MKKLIALLILAAFVSTAAIGCASPPRSRAAKA